VSPSREQVEQISTGSPLPATLVHCGRPLQTSLYHEPAVSRLVIKTKRNIKKGEEIGRFKTQDCPASLETADFFTFFNIFFLF